MKQTIFTTVLIHPILQLALFLLVVIGGQVFAAPYGWIIRYALVTGEFFAITGIVAVVLTLASLFVARVTLQFTGLIAMWVSLIAFYAQTKPEARDYMFGTPITIITALLFILISCFVILKHMRWKN